MSLLTSSSADRSDACRTAVAASLAAAADSLATIDSGRSQSTPSPLFSTSSLDSCATPQPSNDFAQLLADARDRDGTVLFSDAAALVALSHCDRSLLNPRCGALTNDILQYRLQPLVRVPHLVVCGAGGDWEETDALPLSATSPAEWVGLEGKSAVSSSAVVRQGELLLTGGLGHDCSILSPRTCRWRDGSPMPRKRSIHCSAQLGGVSVVCGGWDSVVALSSTLLLLLTMLRSGRRAVQWQMLATLLEVRSSLLQMRARIACWSWAAPDGTTALSTPVSCTTPQLIAGRCKIHGYRNLCAVMLHRSPAGVQCSLCSRRRASRRNVRCSTCGAARRRGSRWHRQLMREAITL